MIKFCRAVRAEVERTSSAMFVSGQFKPALVAAFLRAHLWSSCNNQTRWSGLESLYISKLQDVRTGWQLDFDWPLAIWRHCKFPGCKSSQDKFNCSGKTFAVKTLKHEILVWVVDENSWRLVRRKHDDLRISEFQNLIQPTCNDFGLGFGSKRSSWNSWYEILTFSGGSKEAVASDLRIASIC